VVPQHENATSPLLLAGSSKSSRSVRFQFQMRPLGRSLHHNMITITPHAADELGRLLASKAASPHAGLRLAVRRGGCAGLQYEMKVGDPEPGDATVVEGNARVIIAADSFDRLAGCEIDYTDDLTDSGFKINNPKAARSCGCGTSFEPLEEAGSTNPADDGGSCGNP